ncbi:MAG: type II toxin-antitoxin system HigB family toxin [Acidobacteria bacterium]|nr:MAG: type II toxin-antitoxin system HigB family toxin [Acidobacteriota bacterium]
MKLVGRDKLTKFAKRHASARSAINAWVAEVERATWQTPTDIRERYSSASFLDDNVVVFNLKGNDYRLKVRVMLQSGVVVVLQVETHAEYDKWAEKGESCDQSD